MIDPASWRGLEALVVSPAPTHPQDHGNRKRIFEVCRALQRRGAKIHFVHYPGEHDWRHDRPAGPEAAMAAQWDSYQLVAPSRPLHTAAAKDDHELDEWADPAVSQYLAWACAKRRYDVAIVNYTWMSFALDAIPASVFKVLDTHDVFADRRKMLNSLGVSPEFFHTTRLEEARGLRRADLVLAIKDAERDYFERELGVAHCLTLLHAEPQRDGWRSPPSRDGWLRAGVIGARNNVNRSNLERFLQAALPVFFKYMAPVKIVIAGGCSDDFRNMCRTNVEVVGRVPDVDAIYRSVDVVIAPLEISTGLKIKVGEALASGAPLIAHEHAMDGYPSLEPLHRLPSFEAMAVELAKLSFERAPLAKLAAKSHAVCADIQASVDAALATTRDGVAAKTSTKLCLIAPIEALDSRSLLRDHFHAAVEYLSSCADIEVFLLGETGEPSLEGLHGYNLNHRVFVDPAARQRLGDRAPGAWTATRLRDLLSARGYRRAYIMADCREDLRFGAGQLQQTFLRHDMVELGGADADALAERLRQLGEVCLIGAAPQRIQHWRDRPGVGATLCAPVRRNGEFRRLGESSDELLDVLLLAGAQDAVAAAVLDLCHRMGTKTRALDPADPAAARAVVCRPDGADPLAGLRQAKVLVDLSSHPTSLSATLGEAAMRQGIPHIVFVRGAQALGLWRFPHRLRPASLGQLLRVVAEAVRKPAALREAAAQEIFARTANDAGWSELCRRLTEASPKSGAERPAAAVWRVRDIAGGVADRT